MKCLTFGVTSSPFVATRVLHKLAEKVENQRVPDTTQFYVDDCLSGGATVSEAAELVDSLTTALLSAGMILRKFRSNDRELLQHIPEHLREEPDKCWPSSQLTRPWESTGTQDVTSSGFQCQWWMT